MKVSAMRLAQWIMLTIPTIDDDVWMLEDYESDSDDSSTEN